MTQRGRGHACPLEGIELLGQGCEFCFFFVVCQMQMVGEQRGSREVVRRIGKTEPRNQRRFSSKILPRTGELTLLAHFSVGAQLTLGL